MRLPDECAGLELRCGPAILCPTDLTRWIARTALDGEGARISGEADHRTTTGWTLRLIEVELAVGDDGGDSPITELHGFYALVDQVAHAVARGPRAPMTRSRDALIAAFERVQIDFWSDEIVALDQLWSVR